MGPGLGLGAGSAARLLAASGEGERGLVEAVCVLDEESGGLSARLLRASVTAPLSDLLSLRLGRQLIGFGCGLVWNPANALDPAREPFDREAPRQGVDAAMLVLDLAPLLGRPLSLSLEAAAPEDGRRSRPSEWTAAAQLYLYEGGAELSLFGDCRSPQGLGSLWSAGAWGSLEFAGIVLGIEAAWRRSERVFSLDPYGSFVSDTAPALSALADLSARRGDFFVFAEGYYSEANLGPREAGMIGRAAARDTAALLALAAQPGSIGRLHAALGLEWAAEPFGAGATAIFDIEEGAAACGLSWLWAPAKDLELRLEASMPFRSALVSEYDFSPLRWAARLVLEAYF
jgi:hypothetical protein